jgi:tripartite-type tricarboxylate transporter receptor subunit TctC
VRTGQLLTLLAVLFLAQSSVAQPTVAYPNRALTVVVPMAAGGTADLLARTMAPALSTLLGQTIVIENRVGANGSIGEEYVSRAKPDGYTLMLESTSIATNPWMNTLNYDPRRAFIPVIQIAAVPLVLVVNSQVNAQTAQEFAALAKGQAKKLNYASWGNGSIGHFAGETFQIASKVPLAHVPYKSTTQALNDTLSGQVEAMFPTLPLALQHLRAGKIRALALASAVRSPMAPDIPTMAEAGFAGVEVETWFGVFVPTGTAPAQVQRIQQAVQTVLSQADMKTRLESQGFRIIGGSSADFSKFFLSEVDLYERIVKQANLKQGD